jgi:hypothetical protein
VANPVIVVEGKEEVISALELVKNKIWAMSVQLVDEISKTGAKFSQGWLEKTDGVDTGALRASIVGGIDDFDDKEIRGSVSAGNPRIVRGVGEFTYSRKTKKIVQPYSTDKYAEAVEYGFTAPPKYYMTETYLYLKDMAPKKFMSMLRKAIGRV